MKAFLLNWKTSVPGALSIVCGSAEYFEVLPENYKNTALAFCALMVGLGLIAAKDADKTGVAKSVALIAMLTLLSGCATSKAPYFCTLATSDEVKNAATEIMKDVKPGTDKDKAELALRIADISADAGCTAIKAIEAKKAKP